MNTYFTWKDLLWYVLIEVLAYAIFFIVLGVAFYFFPDLQKYKDIVTMCSVFFGQIAFLFPIIFFYFRKNRSEFFSRLGFNNVSWKELLLYPLGVFIVMQVGLSSLSALLAHYAFEIPGFSGEQKNIFGLLGDNTWQVVAIFFIAAVLAPIIEEIVFRGFLLSVLRSYMPTWIAVMLSGCIFALMHGELGVVFMLFFIACGFSFLFIKTKSIYPGIVYHTLNNLFALSILLLMQ